MWRTPNYKNSDLANSVYLGGNGKKLSGGAHSLPGKGQALKGRNKLAARFSNNGIFFFLLVATGEGKKESKWWEWLGRKNSSVWVSPKLTSQYTSKISLTSRDIYNPGGSRSLLIAALKTKVWCIPDTKRAWNFHQDACWGWLGILMQILLWLSPSLWLLSCFLVANKLWGGINIPDTQSSFSCLLRGYTSFQFGLGFNQRATVWNLPRLGRRTSTANQLLLKCYF